MFEFRHPSWYERNTYQLLERYRASMCLHDKAGSAVLEEVTGPCVYVRFHGTSGHYHGSYGNEAVATRNALRLRELVTALGRPRRESRAS